MNKILIGLTLLTSVSSYASLTPYSGVAKGTIEINETYVKGKDKEYRLSKTKNKVSGEFQLFNEDKLVATTPITFEQEVLKTADTKFKIYYDKAGGFDGKQRILRFLTTSLTYNLSEDTYLKRLQGGMFKKYKWEYVQSSLHSTDFFLEYRQEYNEAEEGDQIIAFSENLPIVDQVSNKLELDLADYPEMKGFEAIPHFKSREFILGSAVYVKYKDLKLNCNEIDRNTIECKSVISFRAKNKSNAYQDIAYKKDLEVILSLEEFSPEMCRISSKESKAVFHIGHNLYNHFKQRAPELAEQSSERLENLYRFSESMQNQIRTLQTVGLHGAYVDSCMNFINGFIEHQEILNEYYEEAF